MISRARVRVLLNVFSTNNLSHLAFGKLVGSTPSHFLNSHLIHAGGWVVKDTYYSPYHTLCLLEEEEFHHLTTQYYRITEKFTIYLFVCVYVCVISSIMTSFVGKTTTLFPFPLSQYHQHNNNRKRFPHWIGNLTV